MPDFPPNAFLVCDYTDNHPTCWNGEPYWRPTALVYSREAADRWAGDDCIVISVDDDEGAQLFRGKHVTLREAQILLGTKEAA